MLKTDGMVEHLSKILHLMLTISSNEINVAVRGNKGAKYSCELRFTLILLMKESPVHFFLNFFTAPTTTGPPSTTTGELLL